MSRAAESTWSTAGPGELIAAELSRLGKSQAWLAAAAGVSVKHVNRVANGHSRLSADVALRVSDHLAVSARQLLHAQADVDLAEALRKGGARGQG